MENNKTYKMHTSVGQLILNEEISEKNCCHKIKKIAYGKVGIFEQAIQYLYFV